jgi:hypothetical protein
MRTSVLPPQGRRYCWNYRQSTRRNRKATVGAAGVDELKQCLISSRRLRADRIVIHRPLSRARPRRYPPARV